MEYDDDWEEFYYPDGLNGILTDSDRDYLLHPDEWEGDKSQKRFRIRQKVKNALHDFRLLNGIEREGIGLNDKELELIFEDLNEPSVGAPVPTQKHDLASVITFLQRACNTTADVSLEEIIEEGLRPTIPREKRTASGEKLVAKSVDVDVSINVNVNWGKSQDVEEIEAQLKRGERITPTQIGILYLHGRLEPGDLGGAEVEYSDWDYTPQFEIDPLPGLNPPYPPIEGGWKEELRETLTEEAAELVEWEDVRHPVEVWEQLREHYDDPKREARRRDSTTE